MSGVFRYFCVLAEMRTGSNFLEANLNAAPGVISFGEAFNPHFMGKKGHKEMLGVALNDRNEDPFALLEQIKAQKGFPGFRLFADHDPRIIDHVLSDPSCAKIILRRDPLESYVSLLIARATGQWRLSNVQHRKTAKVIFDPDGFAAYRTEITDYYNRLEHGLQVNGETAFRISFDDIGSLSIMNGLLAFMGQTTPLKAISRETKRQNPGPLRDKLTNPEALDELGAQAPAASGPSVPIGGGQVRAYVAAPKAGLLFQPLFGRAEPQIETWLAKLDQADPDDVLRGFNQKSLRQWRRRHSGHRSFTLVRHPVTRAYQAFCQNILTPGPLCMVEMRSALRTQYGLPLPEGPPSPALGGEELRELFVGFLDFLAKNLSGQTPFRIPIEWAPQHDGLRAISAVAPPDLVVRETSLERDLTFLARSIKCKPTPLQIEAQDQHVPMCDIYDGKIEAAVREIYQRDYLTFGFEAWSVR